MFYRLKLASSNVVWKICSKRNLWQWLNIVFNSVDEDRRKKLGPDRTCAEWLLRNGAAVKWTTADEYLSDYNGLPPEGTKMYISEVDATDSSITHHGFLHFIDCKYIEKIILHKCRYLEDQALPLLKPLQDTLKFLQVSRCNSVTDEGLSALAVLSNLQTLTLFGLPYVRSKESVVQNLSKHLPKCNITFK